MPFSPTPQSTDGLREYLLVSHHAWLGPGISAAQTQGSVLPWACEFTPLVLGSQTADGWNLCRKLITQPPRDCCDHRAIEKFRP